MNLLLLRAEMRGNGVRAIATMTEYDRIMAEF